MHAKEEPNHSINGTVISINVHMHHPPKSFIFLDLVLFMLYIYIKVSCFSLHRDIMLLCMCYVFMLFARACDDGATT